MSIFEHHHDKPEPPKPEPPAHDVPVTHDQPQPPPPAHPDGKPEQKSAPQGKAATMLVTDEAVLRNRFFLLWGA